MVHGRSSEGAIPRHPKKEIEQALALARVRGWTWRAGGHWGVISCPHGHVACRESVPGTPRVPGDAARRIRRRLGRCPGP